MADTADQHAESVAERTPCRHGHWVVTDCMVCTRSTGGPMPTDKRPEGWTDRHEVIAQALYADEWTEPNEEYGPEWHHRFAWWQCVAAANLVVTALAHIDGLAEE